MVHSSCILSLICVWFPLATACYSGRVPKENNSVPLLQDFKVKLSPGLIQLTWHCNITKSMEELQYNVDLQSGHLEKLNVSRCSFEYDIHKSIEFIVHKGLSVELQVCSGSKLLYIGKQLTYMPEGKNNSAAENFACVIYNVYIMNCSWTVGKEAPEDVQYSLVLWQKKKNIDCQQYRCDSFGRQVGCVFNHPNINYGSKVYVEVRGLSNQTSVQFFDKVYWPIEDGKVILDPPSNITLTYRSDDLEIKWEKPEIQSEPDSCFMYNININNKEEVNISEKNIYITPKYHQNERIYVTIRVKWNEDCSKYQEWSAWSKPYIIGDDSTQLTPHHILIVIGVGTAIILIVIVLVCYRFRIWKKLFPQVPKPSMKLFEQVEENQKAGQKMSAAEIPLMTKDEEEFTCSNVTEIPETISF